MTPAQNEFDRGYADAWEAFRPGAGTGDPQSVSEGYELGWWNGIGDASAWNEGYDAALAGVMVCPYIDGADDDCFRPGWMLGYLTAFESSALEVRGRA